MNLEKLSGITLRIFEENVSFGERAMSNGGIVIVGHLSCIQFQTHIPQKFTDVSRVRFNFYIKTVSVCMLYVCVL